MKALEILKHIRPHLLCYNMPPEFFEKDIDEAIAELEALQQRSCDGCKYGKEEMEYEDIRYFCIHKDIHYFAYSPPYDFCCNRYEPKENK